MGGNSPGSTSSDYWNKTTQLGTSIIDQIRQMQGSQNQQQQGNTSSTGNTTTTTSLAPGQDQNIGVLLQGARDAYAKSQATPTTLEGRQQQANFSQGAGGALIGQALAGDRQLLNTNGITDPQNDPSYRAMADALTGQVNKNLMETVLPQVRSGAIANNALGGSRADLVTGKAVGDASSGLASSLAGLLSNTRGQNIGIYDAAAGRTGSNYALGLAPGMTLENLGQKDQQDRTQALQTLQALSGTSGQYGGSQSTTGTQNQASTSSGVTNTSQTESNRAQTDTVNRGLTTGYGQGTQQQGTSSLQTLGTVIALMSLFM